MSLCDGEKERGLEVDAERRGVGDAAVLRACDFRGGEGEGDGEVAGEHAEKADKEPVHVAAALATYLETGFDRIDLFCFLDGLGVFEILDENVLIKGDLSDGDYAEAAEYFARLCDELLTDAKNGTPYNESFGAIDDGDTGTGSVLPPPMWILISIAVGVITALIVVCIMKGKLKTVKMQASANNYLKNGSLNITDSSDIFLYSNVTRTAKPKNNDNDSSTHESSSGNTYGGGGGKF